MKRASTSVGSPAFAEPKGTAQAKPRAPRKVPSLTAAQIAFHSGTGKSGVFSLKNALELYSSAGVAK